MEQWSNTLAFVAISESVGLLIGLSTHIYAIFVAEVIPNRVVRIVTCSNSIDIETLHETDVFYHAFTRYYISSIRIHLMTVGTLDKYWLAIDEHLGILYLYLAETYLLGYYLSPILCCCEGIEIWLLCTPLIGIGELYLCFLTLTNDIGNFLTRGIFQGICDF